MDGFEHGGGAAIRIDCSIHPGVAMIAGDDPLIRRSRSSYLANHVPDCAVLIVLLQVDLHLRWSGTYVIRKWQRSLPLAGRGGAPPVIGDAGRLFVGQRGYG